MPRIDEATRQARAAVLAPLFSRARERGLRRGWLATQTGVTIHRLWNYEHGYDRMPADFIARFSAALDIPASLIAIPEPRDRYIQQPRQRTAKGGQSHEQHEQRDDPSTPHSAPATRGLGATRHRAASHASASAGRA